MQPIQGRLAARDSPLHDGGETVEPLRGDGGQQFILATEVAIGRVVRDTGAACDLSQGEGARTDLANQGYGGIEQGLAQVCVVIRLGADHTLISSK
jgi:hypothetical protein